MTKLTTVAACRVARIDRQRFNEFVFTGDYPCAPETIPGRSRVFDEDDIIALFVFAREIEKQTRPATAGQVACQVRAVLHENDGAATAAVWRDFISQKVRLAASNTSIAKLRAGGIDVFSRTEYNVARIRELVRSGIDEERQIIGAEDG